MRAALLRLAIQAAQSRTAAPVANTDGTITAHRACALNSATTSEYQSDADSAVLASAMNPRSGFVSRRRNATANSPKP
jgi:hypothetical protein